MDHPPDTGTSNGDDFEPSIPDCESCGESEDSIESMYRVYVQSNVVIPGCYS